MLIDSHCHLDYPDFQEEGVETILARAKDAGIERFVTISTHLSKFDQVLAAADKSPFVYCTVGTHPHHAGEADEEKFSLDDIIRMSRHEKVVGIGETGLDYYYDFSTPAAQKTTFERQIAAGLATDLPLVIHSRDAEKDTIDILKSAGAGQSRGVMHCFTGTQWLADAALDIGFYISFSGVITFKKSDELREVVKNVPLDRILVETDAPFLAPMPFRGKRNEPAFVVHTAQMVAQLKGLSLEEISRITTDNFFTLFNRAKK